MNYQSALYMMTSQPPEIHHQTISGRQIDQDHTVCLCQWHHRAICDVGTTTTGMMRMYGPSLATGSKAFYKTYGDNEQQLLFQREVLLPWQEA